MEMHEQEQLDKPKTRSRKWLMALLPIGLIACCVVWVRWAPPHFYYAKNNDVRKLQQYLMEGGDPNVVAKHPRDWKRTELPLISWAIRDHSVEAAEVLIRSDKFVMAPFGKRSPIYEAIDLDDASMVALLMEYGVDPELSLPPKHQYDHEAAASPIMASLFLRRWNAARAMIPFLKKPIDWSSVLCYAQWQSPSPARTECLEHMIACGMDPNTLVCGKRSLLSLATESDDIRLVHALLKLGANPAHADADGSLPEKHIPMSSKHGDLIRGYLQTK